MINVDVNYDNWCATCTLTWDKNLNEAFNNEFFFIEIKDIFNNFIQRDSKDEQQNAFILDTEPDLIISTKDIELKNYPVDGICQSSIDIPSLNNKSLNYYNSSDDSLLRNGFQFWYEENKLYMRFLPKGKVYLKFNDKYSLYKDIDIGFTTVKVHVCFAENDCANFNVSLLPALFRGEPYKVNSSDEDTQIQKTPKELCNCCNGTGIIYTNTDKQTTCPHCDSGEVDLTRINYPFNDNTDNLNVNNTTKSFSSVYSYKWNDNNKTYQLLNTSGINTNITPMYDIQTSSFIPTYLIEETIPDILEPTSTKLRNFHYNTISSYIYNFEDKKTNIDYDEIELLSTGDGYKMFSCDMGYVITPMKCYVYTQHISGTSDNLLKNKLKFELGVKYE